jgi:Arc/MetJ-type ribon-helix-helix transcriptional regulator
MDDVKLSVSLSDREVAALDRYVEASGLRSRSAALQHAIRLLDDPDLEQDYATAWDDWESSGEAAVWEGPTADGLDDAPR